MKHRDVVLDFTSLLDVILIILFFFVLYSVFDADQAMEEARRERDAYARKAEELDGAYREKEEELLAARAELAAERAELESEWDRLLSRGDAAARNQRALDRFGAAGLMTFRLEQTDEGETWRLRVLLGESTVDEILPDEPLAERIGEAVERIFPGEDAVVLAAFVYDGDVLGTNRICAAVLDAFAAVSGTRDNLYLCTINISK